MNQGYHSEKNNTMGNLDAPIAEELVTLDFRLPAGGHFGGAPAGIHLLLLTFIFTFFTPTEL
jgi:hypothetical protein